MIFGGAFPRSDCRTRFEEQKRKLIEKGLIPETAEENLIRTEACQVAMPTHPGHIVTGRPGVYLIGEAAGFISPSSLEGISYGLSSGERLADALSKSNDPKVVHSFYARSVRSLKAKVLARGIKRLVIGTQLTRSVILRSRIASLKSSRRVRSAPLPARSEI